MPRFSLARRLAARRRVHAGVAALVCGLALGAAARNSVSPKALLSAVFQGSEKVDYTRLKKDVLPAFARGNGKTEPAQHMVFIGLTKGAVDGYVVIDKQIGQHEFITFGHHFSPDGALLRAQVLDYRERYGSEIGNARFMKQFVGVTAADKLRLGHEIDGISGATLSARAAIRSVNRSSRLVAAAKKARAASTAQP